MIRKRSHRGRDLVWACSGATITDETTSPGRPNDASTCRPHGERCRMAQLRCVGRVSGAKVPDHPSRAKCVLFHLDTPLQVMFGVAGQSFWSRTATIAQ